MAENITEYNNFRIAVPAKFEEVFTHLYFAENKTGESINKTLLPSYQTILIFNFGTTPWLLSKENSRISVDKYLVIGPVKQAFEYALPAGAEILTVNFKNDAFYRFFRHASVPEHVPMNPAAQLEEDCFSILWHQLSKISDVNGKVNHILTFCEPYLAYRNKIAGQLAGFRERSLDRIKSIAQENKQTERNTQLNHKKHFGYSAKEHNRFTRFLEAVNLIQTLASGNAKVDWFEIVAECGYYDQSQLIKDFKHYINLSPTNYLKFQQDICNPIT